MKGLDSVQVEQLRQIGEYLLHVREQQAISLERVAKETFIPLRLLQAIETGETERLPEPVYVKGFIRRYADVIGLDGSEIADAFEVSPPVAVEPASETQAAPAPFVVQQPQPTAPSGSRRNFIPVLAGVVALGLIGAIAIALPGLFKPTSKITSQPPSISTEPSANRSQPTAKTAPSAPSSATTTATPSNPPVDPNSPVQVDIRLTDRSWMEIVADGKIQFEGIMAKGEQRTWTAKNNLSIRAGNAGAVLVSQNQGQAKPLGKLGAVVDASFTPKPE